MSNQRLLAIGFIVIGTSASYVFHRIGDAALSALGVGNAELFGGVALSWLIGIVVAAAGAIALWLNPKAQGAGQDIAGELRRVTWPTFPEIRAATGAVVIVTLVAACLLGVMDAVSAKVMTDWIPSGIHWAQGLFA
ncbi:preprotein translocase subunit SecE [Vulgatibacter incomptus]|uniref:Preprotein translocase subunit SecE n=1 Tax=Vulgatibacter incomptus TaxID=1391653 RepID=A0A0K1PEZ9_9BACT|nr:preprotein translocase subunit SecE [Vulgatibacter incomptus]AKU91689.1 Preprotein translocase subunit SecE [Vulgatibacter incomptus]